jgi:hypothetical protein
MTTDLWKPFQFDNFLENDAEKTAYRSLKDVEEWPGGVSDWPDGEETLCVFYGGPSNQPEVLPIQDVLADGFDHWTHYAQFWKLNPPSEAKREEKRKSALSPYLTKLAKEFATLEERMQEKMRSARVIPKPNHETVEMFAELAWLGRNLKELTLYLEENP